MICPECKAAGLKSTVCVGPSTTTLMYCQPYYDEEGGYHHHDCNRVEASFHCSNGHRWGGQIPNRCPNPKCGWVQDG